MDGYRPGDEFSHEEKPRLPEIDLAGIPRGDVDAYRANARDEHQIQERQVVRVEHER